jgi:DNA (cytosine-5)-methyltransferase 1
VRILDLFCGAGGAAMGLHRAFPEAEIVGVDIKPQPHYPFIFVQADAITCPIEGFDFIWASPPCQDHMQTPHRKHGTGWMLHATRSRMNGTPWVIENVPGAPLRKDYVLCGCHFGLKHLRRKRIFETSGWGSAREMPHDHSSMSLSVVGHGTPSWVRARWGRCPTIAEYRKAMGIDWMNRDELSQAVPPAYSEYIGRQFQCA